MALPTFLSWTVVPVEFRHEVERNDKSLVAKRNRHITVDKSLREPASVTGKNLLVKEQQDATSNAPSFLQKKLGRPVVLDWSTKDSDLTKEVDATHLRLKGKFKFGKATRIINQTNGFTAAIFSDEKKYSTDFIELQDGQNQILVEWKDQKGLVQKSQLNIYKRLPANFDDN